MKNYDIGLVDMVLHLMCYSSSAILIVSLLAYLIGAIVLYVFGHTAFALEVVLV